MLPRCLSDFYSSDAVSHCRLFPYLGISAIGTPQTSRLHDLEKVSNKLPFGT